MSKWCEYCLGNDDASSFPHWKANNLTELPWYSERLHIKEFESNESMEYSGGREEDFGDGLDVIIEEFEGGEW